MFFKNKKYKSLSAIAFLPAVAPQSCGTKEGAKADSGGVTMMETIVALGILILGIIAALTLMTSTITFSHASEQMIVVVNLAREGIESVRSIRDLNRSFDQSALSILVEGDYTVDVGGDLVLDTASFSGGTNVEDCTSCDLYLNNGRYLHTGTIEQKTIFKRLISVSGSGSERKIISRVYWSEHGRPHTFVLEDHLADW